MDDEGTGFCRSSYVEEFLDSFRMVLTKGTVPGVSFKASQLFTVDTENPA